MPNRIKTGCRLLVLVTLNSALIWAQSFTASVRGVVSDSTGAAVLAAKVTITETARGAVHSSVTDSAGRYVFASLPPGAYTLTIEASGFRKYARPEFQLVIQQQATIDAELQVGDIASTVEVTATAPLLNTTISNLGQVVDNKYIISLPNIARNPMSLTHMTPGVVGSGGRANSDNNTNFVANGSRNSTSDVLLDGVTVTT